jgi:hypothetical protein
MVCNGMMNINLYHYSIELMLITRCSCLRQSSYEATVSDRDRRMLFDFVEACKLPDCPICTLVAKAELRTLQVYCAEGAGDELRRADVRSARGLCVRHASQLQEARDAMAAAVTAYDVMSNLLRDLDAVIKSGNGWSRKKMTAPQSCPVCLDVARYTPAVCAGVSAWSDEPELCHALQLSHGICAPHLRWMVANTKPTPELLAAQYVAWSRLHAEVGEFVRKRDDRFRHETQAGEGDAWKRAWRIINGHTEAPE